jgi:sporulation integral membrane protein YtvI
MSRKQIEQKPHHRLWGRIALRLVIILAVLLGCTFLLPLIVKTCIPIVLGFIVAWMLNPLIEGIRRKIKIPRKILSFVFTVLLVFVVGGGIALLFYSLINQVVSFVSGWLETGGGITEILASGNPFSQFIAELPESISSTVQNIITQVSDWLREILSLLLSTLTTRAGNVIMGVPSFFVSLFVFISTIYFISADYPAIHSSFAGRFQGGLRTFLSFLRNTTATAFGGYLKAQLLLSLGVFFIILFGFLIIGQGYALLLAFIFAVLDFIPVIGAGTVMIPWAVIALLTGNMSMAIKLMVIWLIIAFFRRVFEPKIIGKQTGLSSFLSLVSIYVGMRLGGLGGMVLAPILLQVVLSVCKSGVFDGLIADLKQLVHSGVAFLKERPTDNEETPE